MKNIKGKPDFDDIFMDLAQSLALKSHCVKAQVGETNRLFGSITTSDIVKAVQEAGGPKLDRRTLTLKHPIKLAGKHRIPVKLHHYSG